MRRSLMVGFCTVALSIASAYGQALKSSSVITETNQATSLWSADDIVMAEQASGFQISPDDRWVAWVISVPEYEYDNKDKPLVFLYDLKTSEQRQIFNESRFNIRDVRGTRDGSGFYASNSFKENPRYLWAVLVEMYYYDLANNIPVKVNLGWEKGMTGGFVVTDDGFVALLAN